MEDRFSKNASSHRGSAELYDGIRSHVPPIHVRFGYDGTAKYAMLSDESLGNVLCLQGNMVKELYKYWKQNLGDFGASEAYVKKQQEKEDEVLYHVTLTAKQLVTLHRFLDDGTTP